MPSEGSWGAVRVEVWGRRGTVREPLVYGAIEGALGALLTDRVICVEPDKTVQECMAIMTQRRIRHIPVVQDGRVAGMISIGDIVKQMSREQEVEIRCLTDYIAGRT